MQTPILGASYEARSVNAAADRSVNLMPEAIPQGGKNRGWLMRCPGLRLLQTVGSGPIRALWVLADQTSFVAVSGSEVYLLTSSTGTPVLIGSVSGSGPVSIADNGIQLFFACNPDGFIYNKTTGVFQQITDPDFAGAVTVAFLDEYFVFNEPNSQRIWTTSLLDGLSVDPLDFASAEASPDQAIALIVAHRELWVFGQDSTEIYYDAGLPDFPLAPVQGAVNEVGCIAPYTVAKMDNGVYWLGCDDRGQGIVYRAQGYQAQRVSTHAIEWQIQQSTDLSGSSAYTYQQDGHSFYVLNVPTIGKTWVYDVATRLWHERAAFLNGTLDRHRGNCQCNFNGETIIGDYQTGDIYAFDLTAYADNGAPQKWLRAWRALPPGKNDLNRTAQHSLQLDCETGVGLVTGQGSDPQVMLRWSDDGGHTWSNEHWRSMAPIGNFGARTIWRRLGMTTKIRDRIYECSGTDPVNIAIVGAELHASATYA